MEEVVSDQGDFNLAAAVFQLIQEAIEEDDIDMLDLHLESLPFDDMDDDMYYGLLIEFLEFAFQNEREECAALLLRRWTAVNMEEQTYPLHTTLYVQNKSTIGMLRFVEAVVSGSSVMDEFSAFVEHSEAKKFPHTSYIKHMFNLVRYNSGPEMSLAVNRLNVVFGLQSNSVYETLFDYLEQESDQRGESPNMALHECVISMFRATAGLAPRPSYIMTKKEWIKVPKHEELVVWADKIVQEQLKVPNEEETKRTLKELMEGIPGLIVDDTHEAAKVLYSKMSNSSPEERLAMLAPIMANKSEYNLSEYDELFRIFGPSHVMMGPKELDSKSNDVCSRYGGDRMLLCHEIKNNDRYDDEEDTIDSSDWFTGWCDRPHKDNRIEHKHYAVRVPLDFGGWVGCFCSWKCARMDERSRQSKFIRMIIDQMEETMNTLGIYERRWKKTDYRTALNFTEDDMEKIGDGIDKWMDEMDLAEELGNFEEANVRDEPMEERIAEQDAKISEEVE